MNTFNSKILFFSLICLSSCDIFWPESYDPYLEPCEDYTLLEYTHEAVSINALSYLPSGDFEYYDFDHSPKDSIDKFDFAIEIEFQWVENQSNNEEYCLIDQIVTNPVYGADIYAINTHTGDTTLINDYLRYNGYNGRLSVMTFFETYYFNDYYYQPQILFDLVVYDSIPNSAVFFVDAYLESDEVLHAKTDTVLFKVY